MILFSAYFFIIAISLTTLLAIWRLIILIRCNWAAGKRSLDDFFMALVYSLFTFKYSVVKDHKLYQNTSRWMKFCYVIVGFSLILGVFAYRN